MTPCALAPALCVALCLALGGCGKQESKEGGPSTSATKPGKSAVDSPGDVTLVPADAAKLAAVLEDLKSRKRAVFVDFWATWCGPCRKNFPHTVELARKYKADGLTVVTVALENDPTMTEGAIEFLREQKAGFTNLVSTVGADDAFKEFGIEGDAIPHYRVYDKSGDLVRRFQFGDPDDTFSDEDVEKAIRTAVGRDASE